MSKEFDLIDFITSQMGPEKFNGGGVVSFQDGGPTGGGYGIKGPTYGRRGSIDLAIGNPSSGSNWEYINSVLDPDTEGVNEEAYIKEAQLSGFLGNIANSDK